VSLEREVLRKDIRLRSLFSLAFGTIIGVGWITVLGSWLSGAGSLGAMVAFLGGGAVMLVIGLCYAEMAGMYPVSGGEVAYVLEAWGTRLSFAAAWLLAFSYISVTSFEAVSLAWIVSALVPGFGGPVVYRVLGYDVQLWGLLLGLAVMAVITAINYRGGRSSTWFQDIMTLSLLLASAVFVIVGLVGGDFSNLQPLLVGDTPRAALVGVLGVMATTPFWFAGFDTIPQAMGELREGARLRLLPVVMALAIGLALVFYVLVILTASLSMPRDRLLALELPVAGALAAAFDSVLLGKLVLFAGLCGLITTWNAIFFAATRLVFALGRGYMIPHGFARVHGRFGSPATAVLFTGLMGALGTLFGRNAIGVIVNAASATAAIVFTLVVLGVARLRRTRRDHPRPYRLPGGLALIYLAGIAGFGLFVAALYDPYRAGGGKLPAEWIVLAVWILLGGVFYRAAARVRRRISETDRRWLVLNEGEP
jgi:APA family basic amino acid/polyamine antiporter